MKLVKSWLVCCLAGALWLAVGSVGRAQVTLTVTPAVISNTYPGFITLKITGLTNTEQVTIQRWLDTDGSGLASDGKPLLEAFKIRESGAIVVSGITNVSVPYDSDSATDTLTTTLNFGPPLALMDITGQQIYRVTSPSGRFTPASATLLVTNASLPQSVSGTVYSNGVAGLPHAMVVALSQPNNNYAGAAMADSNGHYYLTLPAGRYGLLGLFPGYYVDQTLAGQVTLTNGVQATNDLTATNGFGGPVIAGRVYDATTTTNALGGVMLQASQSGGRLFAIGFTDTNGNFSIPVTSNNWSLKLDGTQLAHRAYIVPENNAASVSTALGSVSNVNLGLLKGNALYYGRFVDAAGAPLVNYDLSANDSIDQFKANGFTDANGNYGVAILNSTNSPWYLSPAANNIGLENFIFNAQQMTIYSAIIGLNNFFLLPITAQISGRLTDNRGVPLSGISMYAFANVGTNAFITANVDTDTNGNYTLGAASGNWSVFANAAGSHSLADAGYYDPNSHFVVIPPTNAVVNLAVYPASEPLFGQATRVGSSQFNFNLYGANGQNYTLQMSTNLSSTNNWHTVLVISNLPSSPYLLQDDWATNGAGFFRAFQGP